MVKAYKYHWLLGEIKDHEELAVNQDSPLAAFLVKNNCVIEITQDSFEELEIRLGALSILPGTRNDDSWVISLIEYSNTYMFIQSLHNLLFDIPDKRVDSLLHGQVNGPISILILSK